MIFRLDIRTACGANAPFSGSGSTGFSRPLSVTGVHPPPAPVMDKAVLCGIAVDRGCLGRRKRHQGRGRRHG